MEKLVGNGRGSKNSQIDNSSEDGEVPLFETVEKLPVLRVISRNDPIVPLETVDVELSEK